MELHYSTILFTFFLLTFFLLDLTEKLQQDPNAYAVPQGDYHRKNNNFIHPVINNTFTQNQSNAEYAHEVDDDVEEEATDTDTDIDPDSGVDGKEGLSEEEEEEEVDIEDYTIVRSPGELKGYNFPVHSVCQPRLCNHTDNVIWYQFRNKAGLSDRQSAIITLGNIAASLCAKLYYASCNMTWPDILDLTARYGPVAGNSLMLRDRPEDTAPYSVKLHGSSYSAYKKALSALKAGKRFRWIIPRNVYLFRYSLANGLYPNREPDSINTSKPYVYRKFPYGCQYVTFADPPRLYTIATQFLKDNKLKKGTYISLHLRRGDGKAACKSTIPRMAYYFDCWTKKVNLTNSTMLLFTDERKHLYLSQLKQLASKYNINLRIDMEEKLDAYFPTGWKLGVYQTSKIIQSESKYRFEIRRHYRCNSLACQPIPHAAQEGKLLLR